MQTLKKPAQVRAEFDRVGKSIAQWSRENDFSQHLVYEVLSGRKKGKRGQAHNIAVRLGLKRGLVALKGQKT